MESKHITSVLAWATFCDIDESMRMALIWVVAACRKG
jgi:hypothetical protein